MKKKFLLALSMALLLVCIFAISASAVSTTGNIDYEEKATLKDGTVVPIYDEDKNPLIWYISGTETVTVDGVETTKNIYSSVVATATKANPDKNGYYVVYNGQNNTYTGATGEKLPYHYSQSIYIKHITDTSVNVLCKDTMVVANVRGVNIGDFQGGTINALQYLYAPESMVKSGDLRNSKNLIVADYTQSTSLRELLTEIIKTKSTEIRFPTIDPVFDENGVLVNAFTIGTFCFQGSSRTSVEFPVTLYKIKNNAFQNCKQLTSIGYTPYLTIIEADAFENCYVLTDLDFKNTTVSSIGARAFRYAGLRAHIEFPSTLKSIGDNAFRGLKLTKAITLPESLETLGTEVFRDSATLEFFDFNDCKVEGSIGNYMFYQDKNLRMVIFSDKITDLGTDNNSGIFKDCSNLEVVYLPSALENLSTIKNRSKLYLVNEKPVFNWYDGVFDTENWGGQKPSKPDIYFFPSSLKNFGEAFNSCHALSNTIVLPSGVTAIENSITFYNLTDKNIVFLGEVTRFNQSSNKTINYYFINDKVTSETLTVEGNGKYQLNFHSNGVHFCEKTKTATEATCVTNEFAERFCFCGVGMGTVEIDGTALGHSHTIDIGIVYEDYFAAGYYGTQCDRCDDVKSEGETAPIFESLGYSCAMFGETKGIVQGYKINKEEIARYNSVNGELEIGFVAAVNQTEGAIAPDFASENVITSKVSLVNDYVETCVKGISEETADAKIVICLFVKIGEKIHFLDNGFTLESVSGISYNSVFEQSK